MENIGNFLSSCERYGLKKDDMFQTVDLYENRNIGQVLICISALGRKVTVVLSFLKFFLNCYERNNFRNFVCVNKFAVLFCVTCGV